MADMHFAYELVEVKAFRPQRVYRDEHPSILEQALWKLLMLEIVKLIEGLQRRNSCIQWSCFYEIELHAEISSRTIVINLHCNHNLGSLKAQHLYPFYLQLARILATKTIFWNSRNMFHSSHQLCWSEWF